MAMPKLDLPAPVEASFLEVLHMASYPNSD